MLFYLKIKPQVGGVAKTRILFPHGVPVSRRTPKDVEGQRGLLVTFQFHMNSLGQGGVAFHGLQTQQGPIRAWHLIGSLKVFTEALRPSSAHSWGHQVPRRPWSVCAAPRDLCDHLLLHIFQWTLSGRPSVASAMGRT